MSSSIPPVPRKAPGRSKVDRLNSFLPNDGWLPSTASRDAPTMTTAQTGRFTNSTHRQPSEAVITPPSATPATEEMPAIAPQAPSAFTRSVP
jgi:hypothetical protein